MENTNNNLTVGQIINGEKKPQSFKVKVNDITKIAKHVEGIAKASGKPFNGYFIKVHINDNLSGDVFIDNRFVWLDNKVERVIPSTKATIVLPEHFTYNINTYDKTTTLKNRVSASAKDLNDLIIQKEQFVLNLN